MWIDHGNLMTKVTRATDAEKRWLRKYLSFDDARARFQPGRRDEKIRMFSLVNEEFPSGFVAMVKNAALAEGISVDEFDSRIRPAILDPNANLAWLRDYQEAAVKASDGGQGILWLPTGAGKTEIAVALSLRWPCRWLFLVHRATLMEQAAERYELRTGRPAGRIGEGVWEPSISGEFTVATFQTLYARLKQEQAVIGKAHQLLQNIDGLIVDEAHVLPADSFWKVVMACPAYFRIGLSGTPLARGDRRSVLAIAALGKVIYRIKPDVLQKAGVLAVPRIRMIPVYQESDKPTWQGIYGEAIVRSTLRNKAIVDACKRAQKPCLVFVKEITHGRNLLKMLEREKVKVDFVWGSDDTAQRREAVKRLLRGDLEVLICSVIFQEGMDIPELRSVVIGSGGRSVIAALQRIGRGMRVAEGKSTFEVFDLQDRGNRMLEKHARIRSRSYQGEGYEVIEESP